MLTATILAFGICKEAGQQIDTTPNCVKVLKDQGIATDRYGLQAGAYSADSRSNIDPVALGLTSGRMVVRDVSFIAAEAILQANAVQPNFWTFADTRRNVLLSGIPDLRVLIGQRFKIGDVEFVGTQACDPCDRPTKLCNKPGFKQAFLNNGGLRALAVNTGYLCIADQLTLLD